MDKELEQIINCEARLYQDSIVKQNPDAEAYDFFSAFVKGAHFVMNIENEISATKARMWDMVPYDGPEHDFKVRQMAREYVINCYEGYLMAESTKNLRCDVLDTDDLDKIFEKKNETD